MGRLSRSCSRDHLAAGKEVASWWILNRFVLNGEHQSILERVVILSATAVVNEYNLTCRSEYGSASIRRGGIYEGNGQECRQAGGGAVSCSGMCGARRNQDHFNWGLIGQVAKNAAVKDRKALVEAHDEVEPEEDEHLYHTTGWTRELWIERVPRKFVLEFSDWRQKWQQLRNA
ncbi:MAG: hypothetical protein ACR2IB_12450 [Pyrinomonadaceae bacterium]